jgi:predicted dehydrogenase
MTLRIGIIGLGVISRFYLSALQQNPAMKLAAVCDRRPAALDPWHGTEVGLYHDHNEMLQCAVMDAVLVNVPNDLHVSVCRDVINAGLPVCVEKPLATTLSDGQELVAMAEARGVPLFTAFHRRYNIPVLELLRSLSSDVPVTELTVRYFERIEEHAGADQWYLDPERCGGGCVADNGPNAFDLVRLFVGDVGVRSAKVERDEYGVDRRAVIALDALQRPATARVELDWSYPGELKDVSVTLGDGTVRTADMLDGFTQFKESLGHEYVGVLADFAKVVLGGDGGDGVDGLAALQLVDSVYALERSASKDLERGALKELS